MKGQIWFWGSVRKLCYHFPQPLHAEKYVILSFWKVQSAGVYTCSWNSTPATLSTAKNIQNDVLSDRPVYPWRCNFTWVPVRVPVVSCPDPTLSRGKVSGDHWVIPWLCRVSSLDTEQPNEIALCHATMRSTDRPICSLVPRPHPRFCNATQVTWLMAFCWLAFPRERVGSGHETRVQGTLMWGSPI